MQDELEVPSVCYLTDAMINNSEILFEGQSPNITSLIDLTSVVQAAVMNEWLVVSPKALKRSSLLQELDFADTFHVSERIQGKDRIINFTAPKGLEKAEAPVIIDSDDDGELTANTATGELLLTFFSSGVLQEDNILGSLFDTDRVPKGAHRGDFYLTKLAGFMLWLQAYRDIGNFKDDKARQRVIEIAQAPLESYRSLARKLISIRDKFGIDFMRSIVEEPLFSLCIAEEVNRPFEYLEQFEKSVRNAIFGGRKRALEKWKIPSVGAAVLAKTKRLKDLPKQIKRARRKLLRARNEVRTRNVEVLRYEREMDIGRDRHYRELNHLKVELQKALQAFGEATEYKEELEAFPVTERVWWMPKLVALATKAMKAPAQFLAEVFTMPWTRRQSYLRYVPGIRSAATYLKSERTPIMDHLVENVLKLDWGTASIQHRVVSSAMDLVGRCSDLRSSDKIGNKVVMRLQDPGAKKPVIVRDDSFWGSVLLDETLKDHLLLGKGMRMS